LPDFINSVYLFFGLKMSFIDVEKGYGQPKRSYQTGGFGTGGYGNAANAASPYDSPPTMNGSTAVEDPVVNTVKENIKQMANNVTTITKLVNLLGTNKDSQDVRDKLNGAIETTKLLARDTTHQLKVLSTHTRGSPEERNQQKILHQKLAKDFGVWLQKFQEVSKQSAQKERTLPPPAAPSKQSHSAWGRPQHQQQDSFPSTQSGYEDYNPEEEKQSLLEAARRQQFMQIESEREFNDSLIQDREEVIKQIESTITEVNEIFTDLASLVHEQGFMIDNIESNIESTVHNTAEGVVQLRQASEHQKSARSKMCWLALIVAVVAGVLTLILVLSIKK
jgi:t-SNARE complex subunit (syntaxin)